MSPKERVQSGTNRPQILNPGRLLSSGLTVHRGSNLSGGPLKSLSVGPILWTGGRKTSAPVRYPHPRMGARPPQIVVASAKFSGGPFRQAFKRDPAHFLADTNQILGADAYKDEAVRVSTALNMLHKR